MGREARLKRLRRERRKLSKQVPPCSYTKCENGRPPGTHIVRTSDGNFYTACDDCAQPLMHALRLKGIDAQVATVDALSMMQPKTFEQVKGAVPIEPATPVEHTDRYADYETMDDPPMIADGSYAEDATPAESLPTVETPVDPSES